MDSGQAHGSSEVEEWKGWKEKPNFFVTQKGIEPHKPKGWQHEWHPFGTQKWREHHRWNHSIFVNDFGSSPSSDS